MFHRVVATCFEDVEKANQIGIHIGARIFDGITNTRLSAEVYDDCGFVGFKYSVDGCFI